MKILIGGASSKKFHLKEFADALTKFDVEYKLVNDTEISDGYPSRKISKWFKNNKTNPLSRKPVTQDWINKNMGEQDCVPQTEGGKGKGKRKRKTKKSTKKTKKQTKKKAPKRKKRN